MQLSEKIFYFRKKCNISQEELAEKIGVSRQTISRWEKGQTTPDSLMLKQVAKVFGVTVEELLGEDRPDEKENVLNQNNDLIMMLLLGIFLGVTCLLPVIGVIVPIIIFFKYKRKRYLWVIKILAIMCLCIGIYNTCVYIDLLFIDNGSYTIEKLD